jgi:hypothetical protein
MGSAHWKRSRLRPVLGLSAPVSGSSPQGWPEVSKRGRDDTPTPKTLKEIPLGRAVVLNPVLS